MLAYTQRIGALEDSFLGMGLPLTAMRLLFEIGSTPVMPFKPFGKARAGFGLPSPLLRQLEAEGLVEGLPDLADGRRRRGQADRSGEATMGCVGLAVPTKGAGAP